MATENSTITLRDIAEAAGVSIGTVSLALNEGKGIAPATRQRILEVARSLGYERGVRRSSARTVQTVSILIERLPVAPTSDPFNRAILLGLEAGARRLGYRIALEFVSPSDHPSVGHWIPEVTAGVIILGGGDLGFEWVQAAIESNLPVVMLDHFIPGVELPTVVPDNFSGAHALTRYLLEMGHKRIGFIRGPSKYWTLGERQAGYMLAMQHASLGPDTELIPSRVSSGEEKGYGEMQILLALPDPPTAVFAVSDKTAIGAYRAALDRGLNIPGDISIVGFDDTELAQVLNPPLTTMQIPGEIMGRVAFERLVELMEDMDRLPSLPIKWSIPTRLIVRKSVRNLYQ
jgi:DNA-binding LacI/PurR family transcriptional regulator